MSRGRGGEGVGTHLSVRSRELGGGYQGATILVRVTAVYSGSNRSLEKLLKY